MSEDSPFRDRAPLPDDVALDILDRCEIVVLGRMPHSSNATFLVDLADGECVVAQGIYKPARGERPLWDFPHGLWTREVASYALSDQLGWGLVPPTVKRDGPLGPGSLQLFIPHDMREHYFTLREDDRHRATFERLCVFDVVSNNTDRKSGHCLLGTDQRIWAIDNGLSFHAQFKLRTVLWDYAGDPIPDAILDDVERLLDDGLDERVSEDLDPFETDAVYTRARAVVSERRFPYDATGRRWPWPLV